jgi:hypothetical protein
MKWRVRSEYDAGRRVWDTGDMRQYRYVDIFRPPFSHTTELCLWEEQSKNQIGTVRNVAEDQ